MREIKFRAWDNENNCWYEPTHEAYAGNLFELLVSFNGDLTANTMSGLNHESLWPGRYVLMQYTGLKDKNGVEIYEGDILRSTCNCGFTDDKITVEWQGIRFKAVHYYSHDWDQQDLWRDCEVIGNIYENPELLEGGV